MHKWLTTVLLLCFASGLVSADTTGVVPDSSVVFVRVTRMQDDPGVAWLGSTWLDTDRESPLRDVLRDTRYQEAAVVVLPSDSDQRIAMIIDLGGTPDTGVLDRAIAADGQTQNQSVSGVEVRVATNPIPGEDFTAYAIDGSTVVLASDPGAVAEVLGGSAMSGAAGFRQMAGEVDTSADGLLFADNENLRFADFLAPLERKWQMSLLLSAMDLEWMASGFDVVDANRVTGTIVFKGLGTAAVPDIADDADFLGETFRRKFIAEDIEYSSNVSIDGTVVTLDFTVSGLQPLWLRLFEQGVLSVIRPE